MIAVSHPGKTGDALYALPAIRYLCLRHGCMADFYTSSHLERARDLFEYQSCIRSFIVPESYRIQRYDMGIQPVDMPIPGGVYEAIYQLGYRSTPDKRLDWFIAAQAGIPYNDLGPVSYEYPECPVELPERFYALASSGATTFTDTFLDFARLSPLPIVQIGLSQHRLNIECIDMTDSSFLKTCYILSKSSGFVGLQTNQLVLANGFAIPRVAPHDGRSWDMRHIIPLPRSHYPVNPTGQLIVQLLNQ